MNNWIATLITLIVAIAWLRLNDALAHRGVITSKDSRKIIHMGTGPLFVACWLLFDASPNARYLAMLVPLLITIQFALVGLGIMKDEAAVKAMSRTGNPREILRGPLYYGIIFVLMTIIYWRDSPIGITALMLLCGGDGLADIIGRRFGEKKLPWAPGKSWIGSTGMFIGGWSFALLMAFIFSQAGHLPPFSGMVVPITIIAVIGTLVESMPVKDIDNITVTTVAVLFGHLLF